MPCRAAATALVLTCIACRSQTETPKPSPVEPQVTVRLFERLTPTRLRIQGAQSISIGDARVRSAHDTVLEVDGRQIRVNGEARGSIVRIIPSDGILRLSPKPEYARDIRGEVLVKRAGEHLHIVAGMALEDYVAGVVGAEMSRAHPEAHKAQAIAARTYALRQRGRHKAYDYCDLTHCQAFKGVPSPKIRARVRATRGIYLSNASGGPAEVFYSSTCGGHTASALTVFGIEGAPGLDGVADTRPSGEPWCSASPHSEWRFSVSADELASELGARRPARLQVDRAPDGWVSRVEVAGLEKSLSGGQFHNRMGRLYGWGKFKSARFNLLERGNLLVFEGQGLGHGVGLCQHGAMARARAGQDAGAILRHYFPGLRIVRPACTAGRVDQKCETLADCPGAQFMHDFGPAICQ